MFGRYKDFNNFCESVKELYLYAKGWADNDIRRSTLGVLVFEHPQSGVVNVVFSAPNPASGTHFADVAGGLSEVYALALDEDEHVWAARFSAKWPYSDTVPITADSPPKTDQHDEMIAILAAHRDGRRIQFERHNAPGVWIDFDDPEPPTNWCELNWRIKPGLVCKTRLQVRGGHSVYVEGGPAMAKVLESRFSEMQPGMFGTVDIHRFDKEPREVFELKEA